MKRFAWVGVIAAVAVADTGTAVKSSPSEYQAHEAVRGAVLAASVIAPDQVARIFSSAVSKNFVVVDLAVFPENGRSVDLSSIDFSLNTNLASTPAEVAWHGKKQPSLDPRIPSSRPVNVTTEVGVAVASGTNPATGRTQHGVGTYEGVAVDNYPRPAAPPPSSSSTDNTYVLEGKLRGYELQEGPTSAPISGYLYFPLDKKRKGDVPVLEYSRSGERARLTLR